MILLHNISENDLKYTNDINECLIHNMSNFQIEKIVIFSNVKDIDKKIVLNINSKKVVFMEIECNHFDIIKYGKKKSKDYIIYSTPFIKFNEISAATSNLNADLIEKEADSYYIFRKDVRVSNGKNIDDIFLGSKIKSNLNLQKFGYYSIQNFPIKSIGWDITRNYKEDIVLKKDFKDDALVTIEKVVPEKVVPEVKQVIVENKKKRVGKRKIDVVIVSVNYNDFLLLSLDNNSKIFESITVVTSSSDFLCQKICDKFGVKCVVTDIMYEDGGTFNKDKAINEGIRSISDPDYILLLDADILVMDRIDLDSLKEDFLYTSDRYIIPNYNLYKGYISNDISEEMFILDSDKELGFFQLFNYSTKIDYPEYSKDASLSDIVFRDKFLRKIDSTVIHLGTDSNWKGRKSKSFLDYEEFNFHLEKKPSFKIFTFYYNPKNDLICESNFLKHLEQFKAYEKDLLIGLVDYGDEIPSLENFNLFKIEGDKENNIWYKETLMNKMIDVVDTDYIIWMDCDLIYESIDWLENIDSVVKGKDFVQLYETIDYLDLNGEVLETRKSILSSGRDDIDGLLGEGYTPGGSWIGKTSILKENKLFENMYVGGGDAIFVYGLFNINNGFTLDRVGDGSKELKNDAIEWINDFGKYKVGYLSEKISHLYHVDLKDRNYNDRYKLLSSIENRPIELGVSIIIPAYESKLFIEDCIKSITDQNYSEIEILIGIDNCVETLNFIKKSDFIMENCKIFYFNENNGPYFIRNTLVSLSKYKNVIFFDADDIMINNLINKTVTDLVEYESVRWKFVNFFEELSNNNFEINKWYAHGVFGIRKNVFLSMNGFVPWRVGADSEFLERAKKNKITTSYHDDIMFLRRQHDGNQTRNKNTGLGTLFRKEIQKKLSEMKKYNNFENPIVLHTKSYIKIYNKSNFSRKIKKIE